MYRGVCGFLFYVVCRDICTPLFCVTWKMDEYKDISTNANNDNNSNKADKEYINMFILLCMLIKHRFGKHLGFFWLLLG